jgi:hypothetical protein
MRKLVVVLLFAVFAVVGLASHSGIANGQQKAAAGPKQHRWEGTIVRVDNDTSYMDVRNVSGQVRKIQWDSSTTWTKLNKPVADHSGFKPDERVICLGTYDEKGAFHATRIDLRLPK